MSTFKVFLSVIFFSRVGLCSQDSKEICKNENSTTCERDQNAMLELLTNTGNKFGYMMRCAYSTSSEQCNNISYNTCIWGDNKCHVQSQYLFQTISECLYRENNEQEYTYQSRYYATYQCIEDMKKISSKNYWVNESYIRPASKCENFIFRGFFPSCEMISQIVNCAQNQSLESLCIYPGNNTQQYNQRQYTLLLDILTLLGIQNLPKVLNYSVYDQILNLQNNQLQIYEQCSLIQECKQQNKGFQYLGIVIFSTIVIFGCTCYWLIGCCIIPKTRQNNNSVNSIYQQNYQAPNTQENQGIIQNYSNGSNYQQQEPHRRQQNMMLNENFQEIDQHQDIRQNTQTHNLTQSTLQNFNANQQQLLQYQQFGTQFPGRLSTIDQNNQYEHSIVELVEEEYFQQLQITRTLHFELEQQQRQRIQDRVQNNGERQQEILEIIHRLQAFSYEEQNVDEDVSCIICLDDFFINQRVVHLPCVHKYHFSCIKEWIQIKGPNATCPICLTQISQNLQP